MPQSVCLDHGTSVFLPHLIAVPLVPIKAGKFVNRYLFRVNFLPAQEKAILDHQELRIMHEAVDIDFLGDRMPQRMFDLQAEA
jgi:hypothetical protein